MDALGINTGLLMTQLLTLVVVVAFPLFTLFALRKQNLTGTPLALWVLIILLIPILGALAFWIVRPTRTQ